MATAGSFTFVVRADTSQATAGLAQTAAAGQQMGTSLQAGGGTAAAGLAQAEAAAKGASAQVNQLAADAKQAGLAGQQLGQSFTSGAGQAQQSLAPLRTELDRTGVSAKQTAAAMRMLPMQMTDIAVGLSTGQSPLMVLMQQGGQLKDSFGGILPAARAVGAQVVGLIGPFTLAAGAALGLAIAYEQGRAESAALDIALIRTNGTLGLTTNQLHETAKALSADGWTRGAASAALTDIVGSGKVSADVLKTVTATALDLDKYAGQAIGDTGKILKELGEEPVKASLKLNDSLHHLTQAQLEQMRGLEEVGRKTEAAAVAQLAYANGVKSTIDAYKANLGPLDVALNYWTEKGARMWDALRGVGRASTGNEQVAQLKAQLAELDGPNPFKNVGIKDAIAGIFDPEGVKARLRSSAQDQLQYIERLNQATEQNAKLEAERQRQQQAGITATNAVATAQKQGASKQEQLNDALKEYRKQLEDIRRVNPESAFLKPEKVAAGEAYLRDKFKSPAAAPQSESEVASIRARVVEVERYTEALREQGTEAVKLNEGERQVIKLKEDLKTKLTASARAIKQEALAEAERLAVALKAQDAEEKRVRGLKASQEETAKQADQAFASAAAIRDQADQQEAANATTGKSKTAIQEMTLALLKHQLAEADSSDRFDPSYIAGLQAKIREQERFVQALKAADGISINTGLDKWAEEARERAKLYADESGMAGLTAVQRAKINAERQVELRLARELAAIEKSSATDAEKERLAIKARAIAEEDKAGAVGKVMQDQVAKTGDDIQRTITDSLMRGVEGGKSGFDALANTAKATFAGLVLQPTINAVVKPMAMATSTLLYGSPAGAATGGGGGLLGNIMGGASLMGGTFGAGLSAGAGALFGEAGLMGALDAGGIALGAGNVAGGLGTIAGALGPIALGLGAIAAVIKKFDDSGTPHTGGAAEATAEGVKALDAAVIGFGLSANEVSAGVVKASKDVAGGAVGLLNGLSKLGGGMANWSVATGFADDSSKDGAWGSLVIKQGGAKVVDWRDTQTSRWAPKEFANGEAGQAQYAKELATSLKAAIDTIDLPAWAKKVLSAVGEDPSMEELSAAIEKINAMPAAVLQSLGTSADALSKTILDGLAAGDPKAAGQAFADTITQGAEQAIYGNFAGQITSIITTGLVTPVVTAMAAGATITEAMAAVSIDKMKTDAMAAATALKAILSDDTIKAGLKDINTLVAGLVTDATTGIDRPRYSTAQKPATSTDPATDNALGTQQESKLGTLREEAQTLGLEKLRALGRGEEALALERAAAISQLKTVEEAEQARKNYALRDEIDHLNAMQALRDEARTLDIEGLRAQGRDAEALAAERAAALAKISSAEERALAEANYARADENRRLSEQTDLQNQLNALTDTAAQALERQRNALIDANRALFDQVKAQEQLKRITETITSVAARYLTPDAGQAREYATMAAQLVQPLAAAGYSLGQDQISALLQTTSLADLRDFANTLDLTTLAGRNAAEALLGMAGRLADLRAAAVDAALAGVQRAVDAEKSRIAKEAETRKEGLQAQIDALAKSDEVARETQANITSILQSIKSGVASLRNDVLKDLAYDSASAFVRQALQTALTTGYLPEAEALGDAVQAITARFSEREGAAYYATALDAKRERLLQANRLEALQSVAGRQKSVAEQQLDAAKTQTELLRGQIKDLDKATADQLAALDAQLKAAQDSVSVLRGIDVNVASIPAALQTLAQALGLANVATRPTGAPTGGSSATNTNEIWTGEAGALYNPGLMGGALRLGNSDGTLYTVAEIRRWVNDAVAAGTPGAVRDAAVAGGIPASILDQVMGWPTGTANATADALGLPRFAAGGQARAGAALVGEQGPEIAWFDAPARIYSASETRQIMSPGGGDASELAALRRQVDQLMDMLGQLLGLQLVEQQDINRRLKLWDLGGIPGFKQNVVVTTKVAA